MLPHQLMDADDFVHRCGYCGVDFSGYPRIGRFDGKEYVIFSCDKGHEQNVLLDISNVRHQKWIEKDIMDESVAVKSGKAQMTIENKVRGKWLDLME